MVIESALITGFLGIIAAVLSALIIRSRPVDLTNIVGPKLKRDRPLRNLVKRVFPQSTSKQTMLERSDSGLFRTGVRHVVFRQETVCRIIARVDSDELFALAQEIGKGAAQDLVKQIRKAMDSGKVNWRTSELGPGRVLGLLSFWDHTGGWGNYSLHESNSSNEYWRIRVDNDFLNIEAIERGCEFWRGYFWGFCDVCIDFLGKLQYNQGVQIPIQVGEVHNVTCERYADHLLCTIQLTATGALK